MKWQKQGLVFSPNNNFSWLASHSQVPTPLITENYLKVFFATRTANGKSQIAAVDLDLNTPKKILKLYSKPILELGKRGTFDEDGVMPSCVLKQGNEIWLYYTGWNQKVSTPYHNAIGLAISQDGGHTFERVSQGPIVDRNSHEPYLAVTPYVSRENNYYKMWYATGTEWVEVNGKLEPVYAITYASSRDGLSWERTGQICVKQNHAHEAICTPTVYFQSGLYKMWFSSRDSHDFRDGAGSYRIGYAESSDGINWQRMDEKAGIEKSKEGWDSSMLCYPSVFEHNNLCYLFYNGNSFGRYGFGYATADIGM